MVWEPGAREVLLGWAASGFRVQGQPLPRSPPQAQLE